MRRIPKADKSEIHKGFGMVPFIAILLAIVLVTMAWMLVTAQSATEEAVYNMSEQYLEEMTEMKIIQIEQTIDNLEKELSLVMYALSRSGLADAASFQAYIGQMKDYNDFDFIAFVTDEGKIYTSKGEFYEDSILDALGNDFNAPVITFDRQLKGETLLLICLPVRNPQLKGSGLIAAVVGLSTDSIVNRLLLENVGIDSFSSIIQRDGEYLVRTDQGHLAAHSNLFSILEQYAVFTDPDGFAKMKENIRNGIAGMAVYQLNNDVHYTYYAPIPDTDWIITTTLHYELISKNVEMIRSTLTKNSIGQLALIMLIIIALLVVYNYMRRREEDMRVAKVQAEQSNKAKGIFLSNMSHDIRTPMNAIIGFTKLAQKKIHSPEQVEDYLGKVLTSSDHLLALINDVLEMSRIESGKVTLEEEPCNLCEVLRELSGIVLGQARSKNQDLLMELQNVRDEDVYVDTLRLNQIFLNLIGNAVKFTPEGGKIKVVIEQTSRARPGYGNYIIRVADTGIGMSPEFAKRVFASFERERSATVSGIQGTGLGMSITKKIVDLMDGTIEVKTEKGKGSEFIIDVDFRLQDEQPHIQPIPELVGKKALVVYADADAGGIACSLLRRLKLEPERVSSGEEAVRLAKEDPSRYSVYLIDNLLPGMSGVETIKELRKIIPKAILVLSAYDLSYAASQAVDRGASAVCARPIFLPDLRAALCRAMGSDIAADDPFAEEREFFAEFAGKRLLLVEDNELNREIALDILEEVGFETDSAEDGSEAVEKIKNSPPGYYDLVLMDIQMPIMDGYQATRAIRGLDTPERANIPIVAMTANAFEEDKKMAMEAGMNDHTAKPLDTDKLFEVLRNLLRDGDESS